MILNAFEEESVQEIPFSYQEEVICLGFSAQYCLGFMHSIVFKFYFKLEDNYNIVMISAIHQHESAIGLHMSPPS